GRDRDRPGGGHAGDAVGGRDAGRLRAVGPMPGVLRGLRRVGSLLLRLALGPAGMAAVAADLGRAVPDSGAVDRAGAGPGDREPRAGDRRTAAPAQGGARRAVRLSVSAAAAGARRRGAGARLLRARLSRRHAAAGAATLSLGIVRR